MKSTLTRLLRLPGLRRYAAELLSLRDQLARAKNRIEHLENEAARREMPEATLSDERETLEIARRFDYYWYNAAKKIDLRRLHAFGTLATRVHREGRTYLHIDRLYTLWQAVMTMPPAARSAIEIGVRRGGSTKFIAEALRARGLELPLYACDTFEGHVEVDETIDNHHQVGKQFTGIKLDKVLKYLGEFETVRVLKGDIRTTAANLPVEPHFGLVHIDVDVYPITRFCLEFFGARVVPGATIIVDDYGFKTCRGAKQAADEFAASNPQFRMLHLLTGQAVLIRLTE